MSNSNSPSSFWTREHGQKKIYTDPFTADLEAKRLTADKSNGQIWEAYPCRWGPRYETGRNAEEHWHVGRPGRRAR